MNKSISRVLHMMVDYYCQPNPNLYHKDAVLRTLRELQSVTDAGRQMTDRGKDFSISLIFIGLYEVGNLPIVFCCVHVKLDTFVGGEISVKYQKGLAVLKLRMTTILSSELPGGNVTWFVSSNVYSTVKGMQSSNIFQA